MDFVSDALYDGHRLRLLTIIDLFTRECLGICVGQNLRAGDVIDMLDAIAFSRPLPLMLKADNGSEFAGKMLDKWVYELLPGAILLGVAIDITSGSLKKYLIAKSHYLI
jgi:putative transposase